MTIDLWMLVGAVALQWLLIMLAATPDLLLNGLPWGLGNRESEGKEIPAWAARAKRASANMQENLVLAVALVLVVHVAGAANDMSALGAQVFLGARALYAAVYIAGIPGLRTLVWAVSIAGLFMIGSTLF